MPPSLLPLIVGAACLGLGLGGLGLLGRVLEEGCVLTLLVFLVGVIITASGVVLLTAALLPAGG